MAHKRTIRSKNNSKIGRNDPCPCGSGKKYKKCCLGKIDYPIQSKQLTDSTNLISEFKKYDQEKLISTLAGLQIYPENHSQTIRLVTATRVACSITGKGKQHIDPHDLSEVINRHLPSNGLIGRQEDPLENLFTENILFYGGNYCIYPGIVQGGCYPLQLLLDTIFCRKNDFDEEFVGAIRSFSSVLLSVSKEITRKLDHDRYMDSPDNWGRNIQVPEISYLNRLRNAVTFTQDEIGELLKDYDLDKNFLFPFITELDDPELLEEDVFKNILLMRPIIEINDKYIVTLPGSLIFVLNHFIWAISHKYNLQKRLAEKYRETLWSNIQECLRLMLFEPIEIVLPDLEGDILIKEGTYRIDSDKIAYVQLISDDANDYSLDKPNIMWDTSDLSKKIDKRRESISKYLTEGESAFCKQIFIITILGSIGRGIGFGLSIKPENSCSLLISAEEFEIITKSRQCDNLTLLKFNRALEKLNESTKVPFSSPLDLFAFYLDHHHSFNFTDDKKPDLLTTLPGYARTLRIKSARTCDVHATLRGNPPRYTSVCRLIDETSVPIFIPEGGIGRSFEFLVEGYLQPIWIGPIENDDNSSPEIKKLYHDITEMFCYWLWQLAPSLKPYIEPLGKNPLHIYYHLENLDQWIGGGAVKKVDQTGNAMFRHTINDRSITLTISGNVNSILLTPDNRGERLIIDALLKAFSNMLYESIQSKNLNEEERKRILDKHMPLGKKKKYIVIDISSNPSLNPEKITQRRKLQECDIEDQLDGLVDALGKKVTSIGEIKEKEQCVTLCNDVVDIFLQRLKSMLARFSWKSLLEKLIEYNEAIWNLRAVMKLTIPTTIECYGHLPSHLERIIKEYKEIEPAALTIRILIEIISAESPKGQDQPSTDDLDRLLAITYHIINWGMISDHIYLNIFDHKIRILPNGRIGVEKETMDGCWDPFLMSKTMERIDSAISSFKSQFERRKHMAEFEKMDDEFETAFEAEFGLKLTQIFDFHNSLMNIGFNQRTAVPSLQRSILKTEIKKITNLSESQIDRAIDLFSLEPRQKYENAPAGFSDREDIWPWRYNRRLSFLRRSIIIGPEQKEDPIIIWGPRHTFESYKNMMALVSSGRYKLNDESSDEMKRLIGKIKNQVGEEFNRKVKNWFDEKLNLIVNMKIPIGPDAPLRSTEDLGDIDILLIDKSNKKIFSIECKEINYGRNPREIAQEIERLIGEDEAENSWTKKHIKRDKWLQDNKKIINEVFNLNSDPHQIISIILTSEEIPATYIKRMPLRFISFTKLIKTGSNVLYNNN